MNYHALVPAAGSGVRFGAGVLKQYQSLCGVPMLRHALVTLCAVPAIERVFVVLAPDDGHWDDYDWRDLGKLTVLRCGGETRAMSVCAGLRAMADQVGADDWVLVHDAARPCLSVAQVERLIAEVSNDPVGGILATPLADTLKRSERREGVARIAATVPRDELWQAQTPQMFRHAMLLDALEYAPTVTDEASALEALGLKPRLVVADPSNLKVTWPGDLALAEAILNSRAGRERAP